MNVRTIVNSLGPIDARNIFRDSSLKWMFFLPVLLALVLRWGIPPLSAWLLRAYAFDLVEYYPVLLAYFFIVTCPMTYGMVIGFLLIDEKDDRTLTALQVTPLSLRAYLAYRIAVPTALSILLMFVIFPLADLKYLSPGDVFWAAVAAAPLAPLFALFLASIAQNKVQGFALMKLSGMVLLLPVFAYFVGSNWEYVFGLIPTYWPMKVYWMLDARAPAAGWFVLAAVLIQGGWTALLVRRFEKIMRR